MLYRFSRVRRAIGLGLYCSLVYDREYKLFHYNLLAAHYEIMWQPVLSKVEQALQTLHSPAILANPKIVQVLYQHRLSMDFPQQLGGLLEVSDCELGEAASLSD